MSCDTVTWFLGRCCLVVRYLVTRVRQSTELDDIFCEMAQRSNHHVGIFVLQLFYSIIYIPGRLQVPRTDSLLAEKLTPSLVIPVRVRV